MLKIRLSRKGSTHRPFYRVVVSDGRRRPGSSAIEELGYYDPTKSPSVISVNVDRVEHWVGLGAKPSGTVAKLVAKAKKGGTVSVDDVADVEVAAEAAAETVAEEPAAEAAEAVEAAAEEAAAAEPEAAADEAAAEENADAKSEEA